jgi:predicted ATP-binding protein involved in virulence
MRIDRLKIQNFKGFESFEIDLDPHFNLLVGDNASGKTSVLDALSILLDSWVLGIKGNEKGGGISSKQAHLVETVHADSFSFAPRFPVRIEAEGLVMGENLSWARERVGEEGNTKYVDAKRVYNLAKEALRKVTDQEDVSLPLICSYGTERRWYETAHRTKHPTGERREGYPSRLDGYEDCNVFEIQETALLGWIRAQYLDKTIAFRALERAVIACIDGATSLSYSEGYKNVIIQFGTKGRQLYRNLSDGQRVMLSLIGDLVRRATYLNPDFGDKVLELSNGVVLIDELDLHLHPKWQRRIIHDLKRTFPAIQFITTTHSPQLIGEVLPSEIRILADGKAYTTDHSFGLDSSRVLEEIQGAGRRSLIVESDIHEIALAIDTDNFDEARRLILDLESKVGPDDAEVMRPRSLMKFMEAPL